MKSPIQLFAAIAILLATATVAAQVYKWVDKDGKVQYTDTPPPPGATKSEPKKVDTGPGSGSGAPPVARTLQDRTADYDKRKKDEAETGKKAGDVAKKAEIDQENCKSARTALRDLESGRPIRRSNEQGEVTIMMDEERQSEITKARTAVAASCKD